MSSIVELTAVELSQAIHERKASCVEVMEAYLSQIDRLNPAVNALVGFADRDEIKNLARQRDQQLDRQESMGPLHGFPQAPKDLAPVAGMTTTNGSPIFKGQVTSVDSVANARVRGAGAIFVARSNSPEFGLGGHTYNNVYGTTLNAFDQRVSAGGSSGGAAVAVALNMLPVADGSDMMGSLRTPAAFNNIFGFRTSVGCVPSGPGDEVFFQQFGVVGPMARNVPDLALLLSVQAGFHASLPLTRRQDDPKQFLQPLDQDVKGKRIGWLGNLGGHLQTESGMLETCQSALGHFDSIGCQVEAVTPRFELEQLWRAWITLRGFTFSGAQASLYHSPEKRLLLKPEAIWEIENGLKLTAQKVYEAAKVRTAWYQELRRLFESYDFLVMPTTQVFPFPAEQHWPAEIAGIQMDTYHRWMQGVIMATSAGLPALSAPAGFGPSGLPAGIQIIGPAQSDFEVLKMAHAYDLASGYSKTRSPLLT